MPARKIFLHQLLIFQQIGTIQKQKIITFKGIFFRRKLPMLIVLIVIGVELFLIIMARIFHNEKQKTLALLLSLGMMFGLTACQSYPSGKRVVTYKPIVRNSEPLPYKRSFGGKNRTA